MAVRILTSSATLSTSAGSWQRCEAAALTIDLINTFGTDLGGAGVTIPVTFANACNATGIFLKFKWLSNTLTGTVTIKLQENVATVWTDRVTTTITTNTTNFPTAIGGKYVAMTPYAVTTAATTWRYVITNSTSSKIAIFSGIYGVTGDLSTAVPASTDQAIIADGQTLTVDSNLTLAPLNSTSLVIGQGASFLVPDTLASSITIQLCATAVASAIITSTDSLIKFGSQATPLTTSNKVTLITSGITVPSQVQYNNLSGSPLTYSLMKYEFWGAEDDYLATYASASAASGQAVIATVDDYFGIWTAGDVVNVMGQSGSVSATYTISSVGHNSVTFTGNLTAKVFKYSSLVNRTRGRNLPIQFSFQGSVAVFFNGNNTGLTINSCDYAKISGVWGNVIAIGVPAQSTASTSTTLVASVFTDGFGSNGGGFLGIQTANKPGAVIRNVHFINTSGSSTNAAYVFKNATITKWTIGGIQSSIAPTFSLSGCTVSRLHFAGWNFSSTGNGFYFQGAKNTFSNSLFSSPSGFNYLVYLLNVEDNTFTNCSVQGGAQGFALENASGNVCTNCQFGDELAASVGDIYVVSNSYASLQTYGSYLGTAGVTNNSTFILGSYIRFHNYGGTVGDHREWKAEGTFTSASSKLRATPTVTTAVLDTTYTGAIEDITGATMGVAVTAQMSDNTKFTTRPTLTVTYNTSSTASAVAAANNLAQTLLATWVPVTQNAQFTINLKQLLSSTVGSPTADWSNMAIRCRLYGKVYTQTIKTITESSNDLQVDVPNLSVDPFITQTTAATVAAYTGIAINDSTGTITISSNHTLHELYDYCKWYLTQHFDVADFFTTFDGINYTSTYNITVNTGVALTGGGSIDLGSGTFTLTGTATYDGTFIDVTGRQALVSLTGLAAGSTLQIYNTTDSADIYKNVVVGTSYSFRYTYTADKSVLIKVRQAGYLPYQQTGAITSSGFSLSVSQTADSVYTNNGIDGSTVTEFSLTEGVVGIFIDDPDNITTFQRLYNWYMYAIATTTYIDDQADLVTANSTRDYIFDDTITIKNMDVSNPLYIYGANVKNTSGTNALINATGGSIFIRGDYPAASIGEVSTAVWANGQALTVGKFIGLK